MDVWDKLNQGIVNKIANLLQRSERDFKMVWLQEQESLNVRRGQFSLLTFCHVLFLKDRVDSYCLLVDLNSFHVLQCVTAFQLSFTKNLTDKQITILGQIIEHFLANTAT